MDLQKQAGMNLVLSTDAKPRLKWTPELHQRFAEAVTQLGGPEKATPKSLMRVMGIPGLTLYHLKSHLQKFRLGKSQQPEALSNNKQEDGKDNQSSDSHCSRDISGETYSQNQVNENLQIAEALQMQMEVQRKLHEQIEVQRRLQLRIEAQGKYLHSVLKKAQETLAQYSSSSVGIETAKAELSQLVSIISSACPSSPVSDLTETRFINFKDVERKIEGTISSLESSLTSSESSEKKVEKQPMIEIWDPQVSDRTSVVELPLMAINSPDKTVNGNGSSQQANGRKRNGVINFDDGSTEQPFGKKSGNKLSRYELSQMLDLNSQYQSHDIHSGTKTFDLNCQGTEHFISGTF